MLHVRAKLGLKRILQAWRAYAKFIQVCKVLRRRSRQARKQLLHDKLDLAKQAAQQRNSHMLYSVVRSIAPKTFRKAVRIHSKSGTLLTTQEEHQEIVHYFRALFLSSSASCEIEAPDMPDRITTAEVRSALQATQIGKAVPKGCAPASAWKICQGQVEQRVTELADSFYTGQQRLPIHWLDCYLSLLPKPNKSTRRPESLRPLGLQDAASKAFSRIIKCKLFDQVRSKLEQYPQYAYLPHRSTYDAIH